MFRSKNFKVKPVQRMTLVIKTRFKHMQITRVRLMIAAWFFAIGQKIAPSHIDVEITTEEKKQEQES